MQQLKNLLKIMVLNINMYVSEYLRNDSYDVESDTNDNEYVNFFVSLFLK